MRQVHVALSVLTRLVTLLRSLMRMVSITEGRLMLVITPGITVTSWYAVKPSTFMHTAAGGGLGGGEGDGGRGGLRFDSTLRSPFQMMMTVPSTSSSLLKKLARKKATKARAADDELTGALEAALRRRPIGFPVVALPLACESCCACPLVLHPMAKAIMGPRCHGCAALAVAAEAATPGHNCCCSLPQAPDAVMRVLHGCLLCVPIPLI